MLAVWNLPLAARGDDWITIVIFILFVFGSLIAQMVKKARGTAEQEEEEGSAPRRAAPPQRPAAPPTGRPRQWSAESEELRKFLEALGQPKTPPVAPPVLKPVEQPPPPRPAPKRQPRRPALTPRVEEREDWFKPIPTIEQPSAPRELARVDLEQEMEAVKHEIELSKASPTPVVRVAVVRGSAFARLLSEKREVRRAVLLAEILGPPRSLQPSLDASPTKPLGFAAV